MRLTLAYYRAVVLVVVWATSAHASLGQNVVQPPTDEELVESWQRLAHRIRPPEINKANEFDLSGPPASQTVISEDGTTLLVLDKEGALVVWNLKTGEQTARIVPAQASSKSAIGISANGRVLAVGFPSGLIEVYVPAKSKPAIQYDAFKSPIQMVQVSSDQDRIIAVDDFGKSFEVNALGKSKGFHFGPTNNKAVRSLVAAGGKQESWWKIHVDSQDKVTDVYFDGKDTTENHLTIRPPSFMHSSDDRFVTGSPHQLAWTVLYYKGDKKYEAKFSEVKVDDTLYDAAMVKHSPWMWTLTDKFLENRMISLGRVNKKVKLPVELSAAHTRIFPNAEALVTITPEGHVTRWNAFLDVTSGIVALSTSVCNEAARGRFEALEMIAEKWNDRVDHFEDSEHETPYSFLMSCVQTIAPKFKGSEEEPYQVIHKWIQDNPNNCQFMRIALFRLYLADGYRARGSGYANSVAEDAWEVFYDNMEKSWEVAAPLFDQKKVPAEAYTCAIIAGKNLQWEREEINKYLRQAFEKYPNYHRTFAEEAVARLPRWGGKPGETEYFARFTADKLGGIDGDIMYARIAQHVVNFVGWKGIDTETDFSRERVLKGMLAISQTTRDEFTMNQTLLVAAMWDDRETAYRAARRIVELDLKPTKSIWPEKYDLIDEVYAEANKFRRTE